MCECSGKLIAWMDRELAVEEAAEVERHLETCSECRARVDSYKQVSAEFDACCEEMMALSAKRRANPWTAVTATAGALATLVALFFVWPSAPVRPPAVHFPEAGQTAAVSPVLAESAPPVPVHPMRRISRPGIVRPARVRDGDLARTQNRGAYSVPEGPVIQISIPADEMFPPGAFPQGMRFVADVTLASDGSAQRMSLHPRLAGFERSMGQP